jgi:hypothetical protein
MSSVSGASVARPVYGELPNCDEYNSGIATALSTKLEDNPYIVASHLALTFSAD